MLSAGFSGTLWGKAFSPDGRILAAASTSRLVLWNVADPARPRLLRSLATAPLMSDNPSPVPFGASQRDLVFSPDGRILASASARYTCGPCPDPPHRADRHLRRLRPDHRGKELTPLDQHQVRPRASLIPDDAEQIAASACQFTPSHAGGSFQQPQREEPVRPCVL